MNSSEHANRNIEREYDRITARMPGGMLYGANMDMENIKHLVVATYSFGKMDGDNSADYIALFKSIPKQEKKEHKSIIERIKDDCPLFNNCKDNEKEVK